MREGWIKEENIIFANICGPNTKAPKYIQQILTDIKGESDENTIIVGDVNIPLASMDRSSKQKKINKAKEILNVIIEELDLTDIFRTLHTNKNRTYILFKYTQNTL